MKKALLFFLLFSLLLCGCSRTAETAPAPSAAPEVPNCEPETEYVSAFYFATTDREGSEWDAGCFAGKKLTVLNFFEPWCVSCLEELPDLQKLSEQFAGPDFQIFGVYLTEEGMDEVLAETGVRYPILHFVPELEFLASAYIPTTVFLDEHGELLAQLVGAQGYEALEATATELLNR